MFSTKDRHEFRPLLVEIEERPTSPLGRTLLWTILIFMAITLTWLFLAKIDVVVTARGKVIPAGEIKVLQPIETGVISNIRVKEGEYVQKGQILMDIDPSVTETNLDSKLKYLELLEVETSRLHALIEDKPFNPPASSKDEELLQTQRLIYTTKRKGHYQRIQLVKEQMNQTNSQISASKQDIHRVQRLLEGSLKKEKRLLEVIDIIAQDEYDAAKKELIELQETIIIKQHEVHQSRARKTELKEQMLLITQEYQNTLLEELTEKGKELTMLKVEIKSIQFKQSKQHITAPVDGHVGKLFIHTVGGVVTPAEKLITIVPKDAPLIIQATVLNQDSGFVKEGMDVSIKIDTFDFQKYGLIAGIVTHKSDDAIENEEMGLVYEIYVEPKENFLKVNGEKVYLRSGMSVSAEAKVGKRRVIDFFLYPLIKYLDEGMSVR